LSFVIYPVRSLLSNRGGKGKRAIYQSNGFLAKIGKVYLQKAISCFLPKRKQEKIKQPF